MNKVSTLNNFLETYQVRINAYLKQHLPSPSHAPQRLHKAIHYAVLNGGKRLRPLLVYATGTCLDAEPTLLDAPAAAVELIHSYSLVHDDLPAMDNDDLRRGKPSCHKAFNQATAILVGDALQALAFECLADQSPHPSGIKIQMIKTLATASGSMGMSGGQDLDLEAEGKTLDLAQLEKIHRLKTGALIQASVQLGAITAGCTDTATLSLLHSFAENIGLAFQIQDDILDVEGETEILGKTSGSDATNHKATYPAILGPTEAKKRRQKAYDTAMEALNQSPFDTTNLSNLCQYIVQREC